jgi:hypothetical protein
MRSVYAIMTEFMESELRAYDEEQDFYTAYYLASNYLDFALYSKKKNRSDIADLS